MTDDSINSKLDRILALMKAQLETSRQAQRKEQLHHTHLSEEDTSVLSHSEDRETVVSFADPDKHSNADYEKYTSPTGPRYLRPRTDPYSKPWTDPYSKPRMEPYSNEQEDDANIVGESNPSQSKPITTPFPKFNPKDVENFIIEAKAWFQFNQVHEQGEWWTSKICIDRVCKGRLFHDWHYFMERLMEQFNPRNARMEAYNKLLALHLTSDAPGATIHHVERFRDLEGQVNLDDNELMIDLFRGSLTCSLQEKFEQNPPQPDLPPPQKAIAFSHIVLTISVNSASPQQHYLIRSRLLTLRPSPGAWPTPPAQSSSPGRPVVPMNPGNPNRPSNWLLPHQLTQSVRPRGPTNTSNSPFHLCTGTGHWARECPNKKQLEPVTPRAMGLKVMVTTEDSTEEGAPASEEEQTERDSYNPK
ncbi:uncharacterized protein UBRO_20154 [Ustilago bromivora]|uniref:CCHC-type domain-containing protein n=1 Tax=Ustilago bromivora TaxID=307758 RepID=A0A1K0FVU0_9BASI|nr:uncharacterized protein UBRO_20154 [Ustilago bromivora]